MTDFEKTKQFLEAMDIPYIVDSSESASVTIYCGDMPANNPLTFVGNKDKIKGYTGLFTEFVFTLNGAKFVYLGIYE